MCSIPSLRGGTMAGDRYQLRDATMVDLVSLAYKVDPLNVIGGPAWLEFDHFDIYARAPGNSTRDTTQMMLRSLLADRFQLKVHPDIQRPSRPTSSAPARPPS